MTHSDSLDSSRKLRESLAVVRIAGWLHVHRMKDSLMLEEILLSFLLIICKKIEPLEMNRNVLFMKFVYCPFRKVT